VPSIIQSRFHLGIMQEWRAFQRVLLTFVRTATPSPRGRYKRGLIVVSLALIVIGGISIYFSNAAHNYQSTFNILASRYFKISSNLRDQTAVSGQFTETSGRPVTFMIMSSVQFAAFQTGQGNTSLYSVPNVSSASLSFTFTVPDTYYLLFLHGSGYSTTTQTVNFQRSYFNQDRFELFSGIALIGMGAVEAYWGVRPKNAKRPDPDTKQ